MSDLLPLEHLLSSPALTLAQLELVEGWCRDARARLASDYVQRLRTYAHSVLARTPITAEDMVLFAELLHELVSDRCPGASATLMGNSLADQTLRIKLTFPQGRGVKVGYVAWARKAGGKGTPYPQGSPEMIEEVTEIMRHLTRTP
jgi:hypothetical protein